MTYDAIQGLLKDLREDNDVEILLESGDSSDASPTQPKVTTDNE